MNGFKIKRIVGLQKGQEIQNDDPIFLKCPDWASPWNFNDKVILESKYYVDLIDKKGFDGKQYHRGIVVIKNGDRKIYRMYYSQSIGDKILGLTQTSIQDLKILQDERLPELTVEVLAKNKYWSKFMFFYCNPLHEIRIAFKLSILAIVLALIAFIPTLVQLLQNTPK